MPRDPRLWDLTGGASKLNTHRDVVLEMFRAGKALADIGKKFGMCASGVQRWLRAEGEYERCVRCALPECEVEFPFRAKKLYCSNLHARRANARVWYARSEVQNAARYAVNRALVNGLLIRPSSCERCGSTPPRGKDGRAAIHADHHRGYDEAHRLDIWWVCSTCDYKIENLRAAGKVINRDHPDDQIH